MGTLRNGPRLCSKMGPVPRTGTSSRDPGPPPGFQRDDSWLQATGIDPTVVCSPSVFRRQKVLPLPFSLEGRFRPFL